METSNGADIVAVVRGVVVVWVLMVKGIGGMGSGDDVEFEVDDVF